MHVQILVKSFRSEQLGEQFSANTSAGAPARKRSSCSIYFSRHLTQCGPIAVTAHVRREARRAGYDRSEACRRWLLAAPDIAGSQLGPDRHGAVTIPASQADLCGPRPRLPCSG